MKKFEGTDSAVTRVIWKNNYWRNFFTAGSNVCHNYNAFFHVFVIFRTLFPVFGRIQSQFYQHYIHDHYIKIVRNIFFFKVFLESLEPLSDTYSCEISFLYWVHFCITLCWILFFKTSHSFLPWTDIYK